MRASPNNFKEDYQSTSLGPRKSQHWLYLEIVQGIVNLKQNQHSLKHDKEISFNSYMKTDFREFKNIIQLNLSLRPWEHCKRSQLC